MTRYGFTAMGEQSSPRRMIDTAVGAERAGFDFLAISDHFHPWLDAQGQSPFTWTMLGAIAERTSRIELVTAVTCPTFRYHPAVIAQAAATVALLSEGRFSLGVGAGENLNEHVVGQGWPDATERQERLEEAIEVIRQLWTGGWQSHRGRHYTVSDARLYTLPDTPPPIVVAAGGPRAARLAARVGDGMMATEPRDDIVSAYSSAGGAGRVYGQFAVSWNPDEAAARKTARELWRFAAQGWKVMAELPGPVNFDAATSSVTEEQIGDMVICGNDPERYVEMFHTWEKAGFTDICVVQAGPDQEGFLGFWEREVRPRLAGAGVAPAGAAATH